MIDSSFLKADGTESVEDPAAVIVTMSLPAKNLEMTYAVKSLKSFVSQLGHVHLAVRTDREPLITNVAERLREESNAALQEDTNSPQSLGAVLLMS